MSGTKAQVWLKIADEFNMQLAKQGIPGEPRDASQLEAVCFSKAATSPSSCKYCLCACSYQCELCYFRLNWKVINNASDSGASRDDGDSFNTRCSGHASIFVDYFVHMRPMSVPKCVINGGNVRQGGVRNLLCNTVSEIDNNLFVPFSSCVNKKDNSGTGVVPDFVNNLIDEETWCSRRP
eukprot:1675259-Pleurochrysis_carterae.AAC.1